MSEPKTQKTVPWSGFWSVFDGVKAIPSTPEALMADINTAIAASEYAHATALLRAPSSSSSKKNMNKNKKKKRSDQPASIPTPRYDARLADEAYKLGCAALAAGKHDEAFRSLQSSLSKCPPDKTSALSKLQSLISFTSHQLQKTPHLT